MEICLFASALAVAVSPSLAQEEPCISESKTFTAHVDLFAGELGYYTFEECGDKVNPTIGMEIGETYTFVQADRSNYFHPLGFAYFPDGAHDEVDELEPGITQTEGNGCAANLSCPAPMYFMGDNYLGVYSNIDEVPMAGDQSFGLDDYEPLFFRPLPEWSEFETFSIKLRFDDADHSDDLFYFCHIHQFMSGRIKLLNGGTVVNSEDTPELGYEYHVPSDYDSMCGTYGLDDYQLPNPMCPDRFVCGANGGAIEAYSDCIESMNCAMLAGMTTGVKASSEMALFIHQMIPHHQNAVNMAKSLLKADGALSCDDLTNEDSSHCIMEVLAREIINGQNHQIQIMRALLEAEGYPETDNCIVLLEENGDEAPTGDGDEAPSGAEAPTSAAFSIRHAAFGVGVSLLLFAVA